MTKLLGPDFISLQVRNISTSRAFYTDVLGLTADARFDAPDFVLFDTNTIPFALSVAKVNLDEAPLPGWGVTIWIDCDHGSGWSYYHYTSLRWAIRACLCLC